MQKTTVSRSLSRSGFYLARMLLFIFILGGVYTLPGRSIAIPSDAHPEVGVIWFEGKENRFQSRYGCSGTLLSPSIILTSSLCVGLSTRPGELEKTYFELPGKTSKILITEVIGLDELLMFGENPNGETSEGRTPSLLNSDSIALMRLAAPIKTVHPARISDELPNEGDIVKIAGNHDKFPNWLGAIYIGPLWFCKWKDQSPSPRIVPFRWPRLTDWKEPSIACSQDKGAPVFWSNSKGEEVIVLLIRGVGYTDMVFFANRERTYFSSPVPIREQIQGYLSAQSNNNEGR